jgi:diaminopimelate epimerase
MNIPFTKAHGDKNDFLLTWQADVPGGARDLPAVAIAICARHTGVGADGWMLVDPTPGEGFDASIRLFNSDGSEPELSGNGTRCAAALLVDAGVVSGDVRIRTGAGIKHLRTVSRDGDQHVFLMNMGIPRVVTLRESLPLSTGPREATLLDVGNPQCAFIVEDFEIDWRSLGAETERHSRFPNRTNVSFIRPENEHQIDVRFFERGAGETMSSGTGSTGAAVAAIALGLAKSPLTVVTPAGHLALRWDSPTSPVYLEGPAEIVASGKFHMR